MNRRDSHRKMYTIMYPLLTNYMMDVARFSIERIFLLKKLMGPQGPGGFGLQL